MKQTQFKIYVAQFKDQIYSQAYYFTGNSEDARDITQDVLIKLWHHVDKISQPSLKSWLLTVTKNLCIDFSRKKREVTAAVLSGESSEETFQFDSLSDAANPEHELLRQDAQRLLLAAIHRLPEQIKNVIILREIQDQKYEDIAQILELPLNSVKVYLHRGRKMLFEYLKPYYQRG